MQFDFIRCLIRICRKEGPSRVISLLARKRKRTPNLELTHLKLSQCKNTVSQGSVIMVSFPKKLRVREVVRAIDETLFPKQTQITVCRERMLGYRKQIQDPVIPHGNLLQQWLNHAASWLQCSEQNPSSLAEIQNLQLLIVSSYSTEHRHFSQSITHFVTSEFPTQGFKSSQNVKIDKMKLWVKMLYFSISEELRLRAARLTLYINQT